MAEGSGSTAGGEQYDHLYVQGFSGSEEFRRYADGGGGPSKRRKVDRASHGAALNGELDDSFTASEAARVATEFTDDELGAQGTIIVLEGEGAAHPLKLDSLNSLTRHQKVPKQPRWLLLSVRPATETEPERATVWVSDKHRAAFMKLFEDYLAENTKKGSPKNQDLIANISRIRSAVLDDLWTLEGEPPRHGRHWWELWLDTASPHVNTVRGYAAAHQLRMQSRSFRFRDRAVFWIEASWAELQPLPFTAVPVAEIRRPEFIETIEDLSTAEQGEYVSELAERVSAADNDAPAVCHLDTGVFRNHVLLAASLDQSDLHTVIGTSGTDMNPYGHGTSMAGIALFGDLDAALQSVEPIRLRHRLESVRLEPGPDEASLDPLDYGSATVQAVALPEITANRPRVFALTLSAEPDNPGEPTLWSAAIDALAVGTDSDRDGDQFRLISLPDADASRLIVVAAGNVDRYIGDHLTNSDLSAVEDPAQAWNALTVGAYTEMTETPQHPQYTGWKPLAEPGELSPHSRTSAWRAETSSPTAGRCSRTNCRTCPCAPPVIPVTLP